MSDDSAAMDTEQTLRTLATALRLQEESLLTMTYLAGSLRGLAGMGVKAELRRFVMAELEDTYLLVEKYSALGGMPEVSTPKIVVDPAAETAIDALIDLERRGLAALHAVIAHTGQEPRSEALEHFLEHIIMRKQQQVDQLWHASGRTTPLGEDD